MSDRTTISHMAEAMWRENCRLGSHTPPADGWARLPDARANVWLALAREALEAARNNPDSARRMAPHAESIAGAVQAATSGAANACEGELGGLAINHPQAMAIAKHVVAEFLRGLPGVIVFEWLKGGRSHGMGQAEDVAAEVERA